MGLIQAKLRPELLGDREASTRPLDGTLRASAQPVATRFKPEDRPQDPLRCSHYPTRYHALAQRNNAPIREAQLLSIVSPRCRYMAGNYREHRLRPNTDNATLSRC